MRSAREKSVSPLSNSLPRGPRESASMPIMLPVARSKTGWNTGEMSWREIASCSSSPPADLLAHGLARDLVARLLDAAVDQPLDAVLRVLHDARRADEGAEARRDVGALGEVAADQLVELRGLLPERRGTLRKAAVGGDEEDDLVGADVGQAEGAGGHDAVGLERLQAAHEVEQEVVVGLPAPDLFDLPLGARAEDQDREVAPLLEHRPQVVHEDGDRGQTRLAVVEPGALLEPLPAEGDELALLLLAHRGLRVFSRVPTG